MCVSAAFAEKFAVIESIVFDVAAFWRLLLQPSEPEWPYTPLHPEIPLDNMLRYARAALYAEVALGAKDVIHEVVE